MDSKQEKLALIRKTISENQIGSQEELLNELSGQGLNLTQASLSRYLKEMKVGKVANVLGEYVYVLPEEINNRQNMENEPRNIPVTGFLSIEFSNNLAVIKTLPGYASGIAYVIDRNIQTEILGTIAGDDTILIIPREGINRKQLLEAMSRYFPVL